MPNIQFAPLRWNYYRACRRLFEELFNITEHRHFAAEWDDRCEKRSFVALCYEVVVGFILVDSTNSIRFICVSKVFQNDKIGSKLLTYVFDSCRDERAIHLVAADNEWLMDWYKRYGFRVTHIHRDEGGEFAGADMVRRQRSRGGKN
jgi:ribosomal protein S18 acetylase RimI-like enzyme